MKKTGETKLLTDRDYTIYCSVCGKTDEIQQWPHRTPAGEMIGILFVCSKCREVAERGVEISMTFKENEGVE